MGDQNLGDIYNESVSGRAQDYSNKGSAQQLLNRGINTGTSRGIARPLQSVYLDLSIARAGVILEGVYGEYLYCDIESNGRVLAEFNDAQFGQLDPMLVGAGFELRQSFQRIQVTNTVQPAGTFVKFLIGSQGATVKNESAAGFLQQRSTVVASATGQAGGAGATVLNSPVVNVGRGALLKLASISAFLTGVGAATAAYVGDAEMIVTDSTGYAGNPAIRIPLSYSQVDIGVGTAGTIDASITNFKLPDNDGGGPQPANGYDSVQLFINLRGTVPATDSWTYAYTIIE